MQNTQQKCASLKAQIQEEAQRLGFSAFGVAEVKPIDEAVLHRYANWIEQEACAEMDYLRKYTEIRADVCQLLPSAKSILCLALNYRPAQLLPSDQPQIAWYAYGRDYHKVMKKRLLLLVEFIRTLFPNAEARICVDTAPLFERYWATQAGLGWIGKHTQLILPKQGSTHVLGEILLSEELPPDVPLPTDLHPCGQCRRCIEACPTGALKEIPSSAKEILPSAAEHPLTVNPSPTTTCTTRHSFTTKQPNLSNLSGCNVMLDARRCLSYCTIEHKGELSSDIKDTLQGRIYGCDECQKACPHNHSTPSTQVAEFTPSLQLMQMDAIQWQQLTPEQYTTLFRGSAVHRCGYDALMRNISSTLRSQEPTETTSLSKE